MSKRTFSQSQSQVTKKAPSKKRFKKDYKRDNSSSYPLYYKGKELKFLDTDLNAGTFSTSGSITCLTLIAAGNDNSNRIGRALMLKSVYIRGFIAGDTIAAACYRWLVVYDKNPQGALPAITDILTSIDMRAMVNLNNTERFSIIMDQVGQVEFTQLVKMPVSKYAKLNLPMTFNGTGAPIANITSGALYFIKMGNETVIGDPPTSPTLFARVRYTDS